jgi:hypothetical protein
VGLLCYSAFIHSIAAESWLRFRKMVALSAWSCRGYCCWVLGEHGIIPRPANHRDISLAVSKGASRRLFSISGTDFPQWQSSANKTIKVKMVAIV